LGLDYEKLINNLEEIMHVIGKYQINNQEKNIKVEFKTNNNDLVTEIDKKSEEMLIEYLSDQYPGFAFLSEESGKREGNNEYRWIIDPLDGTTNYANGFPLFCISCALEKGEEIVAGAVYVPITNEFFSAVKNQGAFLNGEKIAVAKIENLNDAVLITGFPYDKDKNKDNNLDLFNYFLPKARGVRRIGAAAYDLCNIARGVFSAFWELRLKYWDIAAGKLIVEEAGGVVNIFSQEDGFSLVASNKKLNENIIEKIKEIRGGCVNE